MRPTRVLALILLAVAPCAPSLAQTPPGTSSEVQTGPTELRLETLLRAQLEGIAGREVIVSRVTLPPHARLPKHWHPGEEFGYVLQGSVVLWQEGKDEIVARAGEVVRIPLRQVHAAFTRDEAAEILVFRVHESGEPERVLAE